MTLARNIVANVLRRNDREGNWIDREDEAIDHDMRVERSERTRLVRLLSIDRLQRVGIFSSIAPVRRDTNRGTDYQLLKQKSEANERDTKKPYGVIEDKFPDH